MYLQIVREGDAIRIILPRGAALEQVFAAMALDANLGRPTRTARKVPQMLNHPYVVMAKHHRQLVRVEPLAMRLVLKRRTDMRPRLLRRIGRRLRHAEK
jgi:hypothetical protein